MAGQGRNVCSAAHYTEHSQFGGFDAWTKEDLIFVEEDLKFDVNEYSLELRGYLDRRTSSRQVKAGDKQEIMRMKDLQLYSWVKEADVPSGESILLTSCARRLNGNDVRSQCVLKYFAATERDYVLAPTTSPVSVRGQWLYEVWYDLRVVTGDLVCACMQADSSCEVFARLGKVKNGKDGSGSSMER